ncbi:MAG: hypothetical protein AB9869_12285 [Verrucomicrobiia bacterium]
MENKAHIHWRVRRLRFLSLVVLGLMCMAPAKALATTLVPFESNWRWAKGSSEASTPTEAWRGPAYDDDGWVSGAAPFYYGEPLAGGTVISDMRNRYSCIFLRRMFTLQATDTVQQLRLRAICDDGFVAWINGTEVVRVNMPAGAPRYDGYASRATPEPVEVSETVLNDLGFLRTGENVLAVQVFNNSLSSSDLQWDAELIATQRDVRAASCDFGATGGRGRRAVERGHHHIQRKRGRGSGFGSASWRAASAGRQGFGRTIYLRVPASVTGADRIAMGCGRADHRHGRVAQSL